MSCATHRLDGGRVVEIDVFDAKGNLVTTAK
jgi:hypothetical protein